jgi:hypothetical protein
VHDATQEVPAKYFPVLQVWHVVVEAQILQKLFTESQAVQVIWKATPV